MKAFVAVLSDAWSKTSSIYSNLLTQLKAAKFKAICHQSECSSCGLLGRIDFSIAPTATVTFPSKGIYGCHNSRKRVRNMKPSREMFDTHQKSVTGGQVVLI